MSDTLQFVDSIASSPTVLLDINDGATWRCRRFTPNPPRLRRAASNNAMRDGGFVSSSSYDMRVLQFELELITSTQDANAEQLQALVRVLDSDGYLKYQPTGATKPVFFRYFRSDISQLEDIIAQAAFRAPTIEVLAEPFALGLRETLGPYTVTNDPAAGSNGCYFDVTGVIGDVDAPIVLTASRNPDFAVLAVRQHGTPANMFWWVQAESCTLLGGGDTTNPGGGPDAAMSGSGTNNYVRTTFSSDATMSDRVSLPLDTSLTADQRDEIRGTYRLFAIVRRSNSTADMGIRVAYSTDTTTPSTPIPKNTGRQIMDFGLWSLLEESPSRAGYGPENSGYDGIPPFQAERTSGTGNLDWDAFFLIPADERMLMWTNDGVGSDTSTIVIDGVAESIWRYFTGDPLAGTALRVNGAYYAAGAFPSLVPGQTNRLFFLEADSAYAMAKSETTDFTLDYWPRYLYVRPSSS